jgi:hypothetical protein
MTTHFKNEIYYFFNNEIINLHKKLINLYWTDKEIKVDKKYFESLINQNKNYASDNTDIYRNIQSCYAYIEINDFIERNNQDNYFCKSGDFIDFHNRTVNFISVFLEIIKSQLKKKTFIYICGRGKGKLYNYILNNYKANITKKDDISISIIFD